MKTIQAYNIEYDTDNNVAIAATLPKAMTFKVDEDFEPETEIADLISDETGFCIFGCSFKFIK